MRNELNKLKNTKLFLLSAEGELHEDRQPIAIFENVKLACKYVNKASRILRKEIFNGDYGKCYRLDVEDGYFLLEEFNLNPTKLPKFGLI